MNPYVAIQSAIISADIAARLRRVTPKASTEPDMLDEITTRVPVRRLADAVDAGQAAAVA